MITLKEAILEFPANAEKVIDSGIPDNFNQLSYLDKFKYVVNRKRIAVVNVKDNKFFFGFKIITIKRRGRTFYPQTSWYNTIVIENNKIISKADVEGVKTFFSFINRPIVSDLKNYELSILCKNYMIKAVLCKKIYGMETFYREYMNKAYHLKNFDWKLFKKYKANQNSFTISDLSLIDIKTFTKNLHDSLEVLVSLLNENPYDSFYTEIVDTVKSAVKLDQIVDLTWSRKRLHEFHLDQSRQLMAKEIDSKNTTFIHDAKLVGNNIKLLNSESEVFSEGYMMHHCLYTNYWPRIQRKAMLAFHMFAPEDCTFSCIIGVDDNIYMDQIFLKYDQMVQQSTREIALTFIRQNEQEIKRLLNE